jgi:hypothetical protein
MIKANLMFLIIVFSVITRKFKIAYIICIVFLQFHYICIRCWRRRKSKENDKREARDKHS